MASSMVSSLIQTVEKLGSSLELCHIEEDTIVEDLKKLERTLLRIKALLNDVEEREIKDESLKLWLSELWDRAYEAEDLLDEYEYELQRTKVESGGTQWPTASVTKERDEEGPNLPEASHSGRQEGGGTQTITRKGIEEVCDVIPSPVEHSFRANLSSRIKKIMPKFDEIANHCHVLHLRESHGERHLQNTARPPTSSYTDESEFYGREDDKKKVIELLLSNDCGGSNFSVIPIVGMGGIGKTALVQLVYNDSTVCGHFDKMGWVCVSEDFNVARLTEAIILSFTQRSTGLTELCALQATLKQLLYERRFLLVLDDVWNEIQSHWDLLREPLAFGKEGSKVVMTTRNESVARIMQTVPSYSLKCLSDGDCWMVFQRHSFDGQDPNAYPHLVEIGKKIVKKCSGLPLAAKILGSLLRCETQVERWEDVLESEMWDLQEPEILPALSLSYVRLPTHLKRCFLYCSLFPKDYELDKNQLVRLWMAQGFIQPKARKLEEDIGGDYFDELLQRSFFQYTGKTGGLVMHDLIHDLAQSISRKEYSIVKQDTSGNISIEGRHLLFIWNDAGQTLQLQSSHESRTLRTFLVIHVIRGMYLRGFCRLNIGDFFQNFRCLRVLDLSYTDIKELPDSVGNLKHLRYLCLNDTIIRMLPDSLCNLYNLQVLEARKSWFIELPKDMRKLTNLRHLDVDSCKYGDALPVRMHPGIGELTSLQTLTQINVGYSGYCGIQELRNLVNLRDLGIYELYNVTNAEDAKEADIRNKKSLVKLKLNWSHYGEKKLAEDMLECLQPHHSSLTELLVENYAGVRFPGWIADPSFSRLTHVNLEHCKYCEILPALGQLPSLRDLEIGGLDGVKHVGHEFCSAHNNAKGFPSLETLGIGEMKGLEKWNGVEDGDFPRLVSLNINYCPNLTSIDWWSNSSSNSSRLTSLRGLMIWGCPNLSFTPETRLPLTLQFFHIMRCPKLEEWCQGFGSSEVARIPHVKLGR